MICPYLSILNWSCCCFESPIDYMPATAQVSALSEIRTSHSTNLTSHKKHDNLKNVLRLRTMRIYGDLAIAATNTHLLRRGMCFRVFNPIRVEQCNTHANGNRTQNYYVTATCLARNYYTSSFGTIAGRFN